MTQIYFSKTLTIIAVAAMVIGCIDYIAGIIAAKKEHVKAEDISKMKKLVVAGNILVCFGMILFGISGIPKSINGYQIGNLLGVLAGGLFLLSGVKASKDVQRCENRVRKEISPEEDFRYFEDDVYAEIAETASGKEKARFMKLYKIPIEKVLYFEDITKQAYEGDIASVASLAVLECIFLVAVFLRHSLLGAALFTITCMMIIRFASEIKREKKIVYYYIVKEEEKPCLK